MAEIKRKNVIRGLKLSLSISIVVTVILLIRTIDLKELQQLKKIRIEYLALALVSMFMMWVSQGIRMKVLATALGERISFKEATKNYLAGAFVSNVTPFASGGGPIQVLFLHRQGMTLGKASSIIIVQWVLRHLFFGLLGPIFFFFYRDLIDPGKLPVEIFETAVIGSIIITIFLLFFVWKPQVIPYLAYKLMGLPGVRRFFNKDDNRVKFENLIERAYHEIEIFHDCLWKLAAHKKWELFWAIVLTGLFWLSFFMIAPIVLLGLGGKPYFARALIMQTIMFLILPYMPTPGASGAAELGFAAFFAPFVPLHLLGIIMVAWRLLTFYVIILVGSIIVLRILGKNSENI